MELDAGAHGHASPGPIAARPARGPWPVRIARWTAERHGLAVLVPVVVLYGLAVSAGAIMTVSLLIPGRTGPWDIAFGGAAFWSWYWMLRALDDLEDADDDAVAHPERMLSRGAVTRGDVWGVVGAAVVVQGLVSLRFDAMTSSHTVLLTWLVMLGVLGLIALERFAGAGAGLGSRPLLRRALRVPVSALPLAWAYAMGATGVQQPSGPTGQPVLALIAVGLLTVGLVDVSRKFAPGMPGEVSWQERLGTPRALALLAGLLAALCAACVALILIAEGQWTGIVAPALVGLTIVGALTTLRTRDPGAAPLFGLVLLVGALVSLIGAAW